MSCFSRVQFVVGAAIVLVAGMASFASAAGVTVGSSSLFDTLDYSDSFTIGAGAPSAERQAYPAQTFPLPGGVSVVEDTYGNPFASWPSNAWSIATDAAVNPGGFGYPGGSGAGSDTGMTQRGGGGDWGINYGLRDVFVVQSDFVQLPDRVDFTVGSSVGTIAGAGNISIFFRPTGTAAVDIGVYNPGAGETDSGLSSGIASANAWYNYAIGVDVPNETIEVFVDEVSRGTIDLSTLGGGAYAGILNGGSVGIGGAGADRLWSDNFQIGGTGVVVPPDPNPPVSTLLLSTDVLGPGTFGNGFTNGGTVEVIRQIANTASQPAVPYTNDAGGPAIDFTEQGLIADGGTAGGFGSDEHGRGGNLFIKGDGEVDEPHAGFGGHANWLITFDLDDIRAEKMGDASEDLQLTGRYGSWGGIGTTDPTGGVTQGAIYLDGVRIDSMAETTHNIPTAGGVDSPSQAFDLILPSDAKYLTLSILSGPGGTFWDDGNYRDVRLTVVPEPSTLVLALVGLMGFVGRRRRTR